MKFSRKSRGALVGFVVTLALPLIADTNSQADATGADRLAGEDRYETSALVAGRVREDGLAGNTIILTTGEKFPDAIVSGSWRSTGALLLTTKDALPAESRKLLEQAWVNNVMIVGGPEVISSEIEKELSALGKKVVRYWGPTRYETSLDLFEADMSNGPFDQIWVASGEVFQDQLIASAAARRSNSPFVLVPEGTLLDPRLEEIVSTIAEPRTIEMRVVDSTGSLAHLRSTKFPILRHSGDPYSLSLGTQLFSGTSILSSGENWPDALGGLRLVRPDRGLILSPKSCASEAAAFHLSHGGRVLVLGGPAALTNNAVNGVRCVPVGFGSNRLYDNPPELDELGFRTAGLMSARPIASEPVVPFSIKVGPGVPADYEESTRVAIETLLRMLPKDQTRRVISRVNVWFSSDNKWLRQEIVDADPAIFGDKTEFLNDFDESAAHWARGNRRPQGPAPLNVLARIPPNLFWLPEAVRPAIWAETLTKRISELTFMGNHYLSRATGRTESDYEMCWVQKGFGTLLGMEAASRAAAVPFVDLRGNWVDGMMNYPKSWNLTLPALSRPGSSAEYPCNLLGAGQNIGMLAAELLVYEFGLESMFDFVLRAEEVRYPQAFEEVFGFSLETFENQFREKIEPILSSR